jgi:2-methylcitrate dehydratase PrpD
MTALRSGVTSALVVHAGFNGLDDIFSGVDNYLRRTRPAHGGLVSQLGERYEIARTNIRNGPWAHRSAPLDCLYNIFKEAPVSVSDIKTVVVREAGTGARRQQSRNAGHLPAAWSH